MTACWFSSLRKVFKLRDDILKCSKHYRKYITAVHLQKVVLEANSYVTYTFVTPFKCLSTGITWGAVKRRQKWSLFYLFSRKSSDLWRMCSHIILFLPKTTPKTRTTRRRGLSCRRANTSLFAELLRLYYSLSHTVAAVRPSNTVSHGQ